MTPGKGTIAQILLVINGADELDVSEPSRRSN